MLELDIESFGAKGDGVFDNTASFKQALETVGGSGGTLRIKEGVWRTGPLELFSDTTLLLEKGAVVSFIEEPQRYNPVRTRWEGVECYAMHPCLFANGRRNIRIRGAGVFNGNGQKWWKIAREKKSGPQTAPETSLEIEFARLNKGYESQPGGGGGRASQFLRPPLLQFFNCEDLCLENFTLRNSPFWTLHPVFCKNIAIKGLIIKNPQDAPNTDGIDIDSCEDVLVENCHVTVGDDGIAVKSGSGEDGIRAGKPSRRITVRSCTVKNGHGGIVIGSETAAGVFDVLAEDCKFLGTDRGIRIKSRRGRGGRIENLVFKNLIMENNLCPLAVNLFYRCGAEKEAALFSREALPVSNATPSVKNAVFSNIRATGCRASAGFIAGLPESPAENFLLSNCELETDENSDASPDESDMFLGLPSVTEKSFRILYAENIRLDAVTVKGPKEPFIYH